MKDWITVARHSGDVLVNVAMQPLAHCYPTDNKDPEARDGKR